MNDALRRYYSVALDKYPDQQNVWSGNKVTPPPTTGIGLGRFTLGATSLFGAGFLKIGKHRVWDTYVSGFRHFEEYFFGRIPRTLQLSNIFSQFETSSLATRFLTPEHLRTYSSLQLEYLEKLTGTPENLIKRFGVTFDAGKLYLGNTNQVILKHASIIRNLNKSPRFSTAYARSLGLNLGKATGVFEESLRFDNAIGRESSEIFQIIGGNTRLQSATRQLFGIGTELVERVNRLAKDPFDFPVIGPLLRKLPFRLGVESGSGLKTLGRLVGKLGVIGGLSYMGYQQLDYMTRNASIFDHTLFNQGITAGVGQLWAKAHIAYSKLGQATGWHAYQQKQEQIAPGSTSIQHLAAFPAVGAFLGASVHYMQRLNLMTRLEFRKRNVEKASEVATKILSRFHGTGLISTIGKRFRESESAVIRSIAKSPLTVKVALGAGLGLLPILPFIPGALASDKTPEELQRIYSGEEEEPVRRGRWWELGASRYEGGNIERYQQNWVARAQTRAKDEQIWGPLEQVHGGEISPFKRWYIENFTYQLEGSHFYDRPYPITAAFGSNIPFVGPLIAGTIGKFIKKPLYMHQNEWMNDQGEYLQLPPGFGQDRGIAMGGKLPASPISPMGIKGTIGESIYRMCFTKDTLIRMENNFYISISNVNIGDYVYLHDGKQRINNIFKRKLNSDEKIFELNIQGNFKNIQTTKDHKVLALQSNYCTFKGVDCSPAQSKNHHYQRCKYKYCDDINPKWLSIGELKQGDFLVELIPKQKEIIDEIDLVQLIDDKVNYTITPDRIYRTKQVLVPAQTRHYKSGVVRNISSYIRYDKPNNKRSLSNKLVLNYEFGWLAGLYLAEGSLMHKMSGIRFAAHKDELKTHLAFVKNCLLALNNKLTFNIENLIDNGVLTNGIAMDVSSNILADVFRILFYAPTGEKYINPALLNGNKEFLIGLLNGFIDGDGHQRTKEISIGISTRPLLKQIYDILIKFGITPGAEYSTHISKRGTLCHTYAIILSQNSIFQLSQISDHRGFKLTKRLLKELHINSNRNFIKEDGNYIYVFKRINQIAEIQHTDFVYDLEIDNKHIYYAEDCLVHNSQGTGLPGFLFTQVKQAITGSPDFYDQETELQSSNAMFSTSRGYYDESLGGMFGASELLRRVITHQRNQLQEYNPIANHVASWLPGPGDRSPDFQHGDIYSAVAAGEERLPGAGFAAVHPELKGVDPEDYPQIWRYKILGDVAPYSTNFDEAAKQVSILFKEGKLSEQEQEIYWQTQEQMKAKKEKRIFNEYQYRKQELNPISEVLASWNRSQSEDNGPSWFSKAVGSFWETMSHGLETPIEQLTPLSPAAKLLHMRSATEDYEQTQIFGTESKFWNRPIENFIKPFLTSAAHSFGDDNIPSAVQERRGIEEYFDILKYVKFTRLKNLAEKSHDQEATSEFEQKRRETLFGINPYTFDFTEIYRALPRRDRDYFNAFTETKDINERKKILDMIPENERGLYMARWRQEDAKDFEKAKKLGILSDKQVTEGQAQVDNMYDDMKTEGLPKTQDLWKDYIATRLQGESYPDWYRRTKLLSKRAAELGYDIPGPDWVGMNPAVDLDDIKLKLVQSMDQAPQDYDLWPIRERAMRYKESFINDKALEPIKQKSPDSVEIRRNIHSLLSEYNIDDVQVDVIPGNSSNKVNMDIQEDRTTELKRRLLEARS